MINFDNYTENNFNNTLSDHTFNFNIKLYFV